MVTVTSRNALRFGRFELHPEERRLLGDGAPIALSPRAFDVLVALVREAGTLVTKSELLQVVWAGSVVEENAVQAQVSALRKALGAEAIATVSRHGYRFELRIDSAPDAPAAPPHNLPRASTSFIGRQNEIVEVSRLLDSTRLMTLVGAGGCGKTRLAVEVAANRGAAHADGVWLVELAALSDPTLVASALVSTLALREQGGRSLMQTLEAHLAQRRCLIVLDNAEHLIEAVASLAQALLSRCEHLRLLTTSREPLGVAGERVYRVPSLSAPRAGAEVTAAQLMAFESARLFVERIRLQRPEFDVTEHNVAALATICRQLDGMPLAIELAAPRMRVMSVEEVSRRIDGRFALLTGGPRTALHRQRTLRATVDWSYDLLTDPERALLCRLSVFAGGWSLDAAHAVCTGGTVDAAALSDHLTSLVDKSLVSVDTQHGATRFDMLQTVRAYARERLHEGDDAAHWHERHRDHFLALAEHSAPQLRHAAAALMVRLQREHANLRTALGWCDAPTQGPPASAKGLRLAAALYRFWWWGNHWAEGLTTLLHWLDAAPAAGERAPRATALKAAAVFSGLQGRFDAARALHDQALLIYRESADLPAVAATLVLLGTTDFTQSRYELARVHLDEALGIARALGDAGLAAAALMNLGSVAREMDDLVASRRCHEESLVLARESGDLWGVRGALCHLATTARLEGDLSAAAAWSEEGLALARSMGQPRGIAAALLELGLVAWLRGDEKTGAARLRESLSARSEGDDRFVVLDMLDDVAVAIALRRPETAARLWAALDGWRRRDAIPQTRTAARRLQERRAELAQAPGSDAAAFDQAWQDGAGWDLAQVLRHLHEVLDELAG